MDSTPLPLANSLLVFKLKIIYIKVPHDALEVNSESIKSLWSSTSQVPQREFEIQKFLGKWSHSLLPQNVPEAISGRACHLQVPQNNLTE